MIKIADDYSSISSNLKKLEEERAAVRGEVPKVDQVCDPFGYVFVPGTYQAPDDYCG